VPEAVVAKLGQANLLYAMQQHHEAIALLMEVIRLAPNLPDPYHTLGLLHEAVGDIKKVSGLLW
jgi:general transcription factor 3C polypeptide 3 (transcription factor C subunit 4)